MDVPELDPPTAPRLGATLLWLLAVLGAAGAVLAWFYVPDPAEAHRVVAGMKSTALGWVWGLHAWTASAVLLLALLHPARAWIRGKETSFTPRRWATGAIALGVILFAFYSGTVLPWDQQGWEAMKHTQFTADVVGLDLFDAEDPGGAPLSIFFWLHVLAVPGLLAGVLAVHLWRGQSPRRMAHRLWALAKAETPSAAPLAGVLAGLAVLVPPIHGPAPFPRLAVTRPDWPFLWLVTLQRSLGDLALWLLPGFVVTVAAAGTLGPRLTRGSRIAVLSVWTVAFTVLSVAALV